jgi:hypothetical protein
MQKLLNLSILNASDQVVGRRITTDNLNNTRIMNRRISYGDMRNMALDEVTNFCICVFS